MKTQEIRNLDELAGGAMAERFQDGLNEVLKNIFDPNTDPLKTRKLQLTLTIKPNRDRNQATVAIEAKTTIAPPTAVQTVLYLGRDRDTGAVMAVEVTDQAPGQVNMDGEVNTPKKGVIGVVKN